MVFRCALLNRSTAPSRFRTLFRAGKWLLLLALVFSSTTAGPAIAQSGASPPVELREMQVKKDKPTETFHKAGTAVTFWVKDTLGTFASVVDAETEVTTFRDDAGTDLVAAHQTAVRDWREKKDSLAQEGRMVSSGRSQSLVEAEAFEDDPFSEGAPGFYLTLESWGLPASGATQLRVTGTVTYLVSRDETATKRLPETVLAKTDSLTVNGHPIRIDNTGTQDGEQQFRVITSLPLTSFEVKNQKGESFGGLGMILNGHPVVTVPGTVFNQPATVVVTYNPTMERTVEIDRRVQVGL